MAELEHVSGLAIIGMQVMAPGSKGIERFGRSVYRGLPPTGQLEAGVTLAEAVQSCTRGLLQSAAMSEEQVRVIVLSGGPEKNVDLRILHTAAVQNPQIESSSAGLTLGREGLRIAQALGVAADWLESEETEAVLLVEANPGEGSACAILLVLEKFAVENGKTVYAVVAGAAQAGGGPTGPAVVENACRQALRSASTHPEWVGLVVTASLNSFTIHTGEEQGLLAAYLTGREQITALSGSPAGLLGLVKAAWCVYWRILPGTPGWNGPEQPQVWQRSPFYVPANSRPWFLPAGQKRRLAAYNVLSPEGSFAHILLDEGKRKVERPYTALKQEALYLFPLAAGSTRQLLEKLEELQLQITDAADTANLARHRYQQFQSEKLAAGCSTCLMARTPEELQREISFALNGIPAADEKQVDWQTPLGSYYTPQPLGESGEVAFVYPGAFNSYLGVGCDLFYLFPNLFDRLVRMTSQAGEILNEKMLYPRSMAALSQPELDVIEARLNADPLAMLISGTVLAVIYTLLLREVFDIHPTRAFGYSLGEISMMYAGGVWVNGDETSAALQASPLFHTRLAGPQNAIREYWQMPAVQQAEVTDHLWDNYVLMAEADRVRQVISGEQSVYLTHINTPRQVVIGGDPRACRRVIDSLKCNALQAPFNYALHCAAMRSEYEALVTLLSSPVANQPDMVLYSASTYQPMPVERQAIARQIAGGLCACLDFPHLVQQAYNGGGRIFIELGAGSNCARWVDESLKGKPHAAFSINRKGVDDHASLLRLLARLVCHRTQVDLKYLY